MFKKILFLAILAGIGFGIYTGIHKIIEVISTPKIVAVSTGISIKPSTTTGILISWATSSGIIAIETNSWTVKQSGFFGRIWNTITGWFCTTSETKGKSAVITTGTITGEIYTGNLLSWWNLASGWIVTGDINTGTFFDDISSNTGDSPTIKTGETSTVSYSWTKTTPVVSSTKKTVTVPKKTTTTTTKISNDEKDPLLDALFR